MFDVDPENVLASLCEYSSKLEGNAEAQSVTYVSADMCGEMVFDRPDRQLTVGTLQDFIDAYIAEKGGEVDYIHGEEALRSLSDRKDAIGFLFSGMEKSQLFKTVIFDGALPRKTFSMGHAEDKRYYLECRRIVE